MGIPLLVSHSETFRDHILLLMEHLEGRGVPQHVIDISVISDSPSSSLDHCEPQHSVNSPSNSTQEINSSHSLSSERIMSRNSSYVERGESYGFSSPLNSSLWISVELIVTLAQIVASVVILSLSRYKSSEAPLFAWVVGYACGCLATLPILYWRLRNCSRRYERFSVQSHQSSSGTISTDSQNHSLAIARNSQTRRRIGVRLNGLVEHFKMALDCFFAVWFVVGDVWIFGAHSSPSVAPKLYRLCIVFLTFSCIGYALPFLLVATIFCCLPCIISVMGIREDLLKPKGASIETIDALPTYKFMRKNGSVDSEQACLRASKAGTLTNGTHDERVISTDDALCCICLAAYVEDDELRELPCSHLFHTECVDKWLKINASCPLCKLEVCEERGKTSLSNQNDQQQNISTEGDLGLTLSNVS